MAEITTAEVTIAVYDLNGDPINDTDVARTVTNQLGMTLLEPYGDRPNDDNRGDPGWWAQAPLDVAAEARRAGCIYRQVGDWEAIITNCEEPGS